MTRTQACAQGIVEENNKDRHPEVRLLTGVAYQMKDTNLVVSEALDPGFFQCRNNTAFWTDVDNFWLRVSEVES